MMIQENINLKPYTTFGINATAHGFATFSSVDELIKLIKTTDRELFILGGGSNLLLTKNIDAFVLKNEIKGIGIVSKSDNVIILKVGGGENWHDFVLFCVQNEYYGVENMSLIPGSVGASPMQNIGAYGVEIKDVFDSLEALEIETGKIRVFTSEECAFGYRESVFKRALKGKYIITSVSFKLSLIKSLNTKYGAIDSELANKGISNPSIKDVSDAVIAIRQSKLPDPKVLGNAGSFFKNPVVPISIHQKILSSYPSVPAYPVIEGFVKIPAGWLIETAGWKGKRMGNCGVHVNQALVLVNYGTATGQEVFDLSTALIQDVKNKFGIELEREVNII
ncbi:MAG: UDP-N-acetylmuramate dehydrogenase [Crocinitomicaceae bacterium]|nr:UDP-N-acetylmuramate dehydrogenase [Crocinitomicaceae bacterium]